MLPLSGVRVVDISRLLPGGFCTHLLSAYGAEVIKVEEPGLGDYIREVPPILDGVSLVHTMINRDKLSVALDLKRGPGREVLRALVKRSDVFVEGFRPGVADSLGFSFEEVRKLNRRIVYCSISSFGKSSPLSSMPTHDLNLEGMAGLLGSGQKPEVPFVQFADYVAGMYAAVGILAALGRGSEEAVLVDVPMVQSLMSLLMLPASSYFATGVPPTRGQSLVFGSEPCYRLYRTADDRYLAVAAIEPHLWKNLMGAIGLPHLARLRDGTRRERSRLGREMSRVFASRTQAAWSSLLMGRDTAVTPILDIDEALDSKWARETGVVGSVGGRPVVNQPLRALSRTEEEDAPSLGRDTERVLESLGYTRKRIEGLIKSGAAGLGRSARPPS